MTFPWAGFGTFLFQRSEQPIFGTDTGWTYDPSYARQRALGTSLDSVVTLAIGSRTRSFECYLSPDRYALLNTLVNTRSMFVDWERPTPAFQPVLLMNVRILDKTPSFYCRDGNTQTRWRVRVELLTQ